MALGNVVDQLHDEHRLSYAGTTEESDLTTLHIRLQQVNHFNTCGEDLLLRGEFLERGGFAMDRIGSVHVKLFHTVDGLTNHVQHTTFNLISRRHLDR